MIRVTLWHKLPSAPVMAALPELSWHRVGGGSPASTTAALMIYVALNFMAEQRDDVSKPPAQSPPPPVPVGAVPVEPLFNFLNPPGSPPLVQSELQQEQPGYVADASYDELATATGLSRSLISQGLARLLELKLITLEGSRQKRIYRLTWGNTKWFKLPCYAIVKNGAIEPFKSFTLRSKYELHALKLYLYLAAIRSNKQFFSVASFETIHKRIGISERDIRKASSHLVSTGLLSRIDREASAIDTYGHNKYYLSGYAKLASSSPTAAAA
ncbi:MAG TPA: ArsR family transcriptional regulator [Bryobacteraceae bacterium]|nr:ArsR family transcriptional regulator [Bryobacteraceae bacterium]